MAADGAILFDPDEDLAPVAEQLQRGVQDRGIEHQLLDHAGHEVGRHRVDRRSLVRHQDAGLAGGDDAAAAGNVAAQFAEVGVGQRPPDDQVALGTIAVHLRG